MTPYHFPSSGIHTSQGHGALLLPRYTQGNSPRSAGSISTTISLLAMRRELCKIGKLPHYLSIHTEAPLLLSHHPMTLRLQVRRHMERFYVSRGAGPSIARELIVGLSDKLHDAADRSRIAFVAANGRSDAGQLFPAHTALCVSRIGHTTMIITMDTRTSRIGCSSSPPQIPSDYSAARTHIAACRANNPGCNRPEVSAS